SIAYQVGRLHNPQATIVPGRFRIPGQKSTPMYFAGQPSDVSGPPPTRGWAILLSRTGNSPNLEKNTSHYSNLHRSTHFRSLQCKPLPAYVFRYRPCLSLSTNLRLRLDRTPKLVDGFQIL